MFNVTKIVRFEAAHVISTHKGQCSNIHGHSYVLHITVSGNTLNESGMIIDFSEVKKMITKTVLNDFDHSLLLKRNAINVAASKNVATKICWLEQEPTAEFMTLYIARLLEPLMPDSIKLKRVRLYETDTCYADWERDDVS